MKNTLQKKLTASQIKYLLTVYKLKDNEKGIRCKDIADILSFTKPSVHKMISAFNEMGLTQKPYYGTVVITDKGKDFISEYTYYYDIVQKFLKSCFNLPENEAKEGALALLAEISKENIDAMCSTIKNLNQ